MSNIYKLLTNRTEYLRYWLRSVSDICTALLRYLSVASQISISFVSDICQLQIRYHKKAQPLKLYIIILKKYLAR